MKKAFLALGISTVLVLNLIIWFGTGLQHFSEIRPVFTALIVIMDICLVLSSIFFFWESYKNKQYLFTTLFGLILTTFLAAFFIRTKNVMGINVIWLFAFDVFVLNVYLVYLSRNWEYFTK